MSSLTSLLLWLQDNGSTPGGESGSDSSGGGGSLMDMLPLFLGVMLIFYFLAWRPQAKERKRREEMLGTLKKGDKVVTSSGIHGIIASVSENTVTLKVDEKNNVRIRFSLSAVQGRVQPEGEKETDEKAVEAKA